MAHITPRQRAGETALKLWSVMLNATEESYGYVTTLMNDLATRADIPVDQVVECIEQSCALRLEDIIANAANDEL